MQEQEGALTVETVPAGTYVKNAIYAYRITGSLPSGAVDFTTGAYHDEAAALQAGREMARLQQEGRFYTGPAAPAKAKRARRVKAAVAGGA